MALQIVAFGQLAEITGSDFQIQAADTASLVGALRDKFNLPQEMKYAIAVNKKIVTTNVQLSDSDTIALLPPFSGG